MNSSDIEKYVTQNFRHNFIFNMLDGSFYWFGANFINSSIILPLFISHFTTSPIIIGLIPMISTLGFLLPQLFTVNWIQHLPRKKFAVINVGFFTERVPVLLLGPAVMLFATTSPLLSLITFFILYTWLSFGAGTVAVAWQDMVAKVIPTEKRGSFFGITNFLGTATGILGAGAVGWMLSRYSFPTGYVFSFITAGIIIFMSWVFLAQTREPSVASQQEPVSQLKFFKTLPIILKNDPNFQNYIISQVILGLGGMASGFVIVYIAQRWLVPDSQGGAFTAAMLVGQAVANLFIGPLADRKGHKLALEICTIFGILSTGLAIISPDPNWFYLVFALRGVSTAGYLLPALNIVFEFCDPDLRPTYIGLSNSISGVAFGIAPVIGGWLATLVGYQWLFGIALCIGLLGFTLLRWGVKEPRLTRANLQQEEQG